MIIYLPSFVLLKSILYICVHVRCRTCSWEDRLTTPSKSDEQTPDVSVSVSKTWKEAALPQQAREDLRCSVRAPHEQSCERVTADFCNNHKAPRDPSLCQECSCAQSPLRPFASFQVDLEKARGERTASCLSIARHVANICFRNVCLERRKQTNLWDLLHARYFVKPSFCPTKCTHIWGYIHTSEDVKLYLFFAVL